MRKIAFLVLVLISVFLKAQSSVNDYKYVIVSKRFDFQKSENQYQLNDLTKFLFKKYNFNPVFEGDLPEDLYRNSCLGLKSVIVDESSMFVTKLKVELRDCQNNLVYTSKIGKSKEKEYRVTYQQAIRRAFESFASLKYQYTPSNIATNSAYKIEKENKLLEEKEEQKIKSATTLEVEEKNTPNLKEDVSLETTTTKKYPVLYAQPNKVGFQLVDTSPSIVFIIYKTSKKDLYLLKDEKGIFYKEGANWIAEFYDNDRVIKKVFTVKF
ncbi:hypothetical protein [Ascidiimonas sp. W6]|uniref:hypothetical protein n=1 Tax=Ascidiimonas meishanensis TaxID=3128903 RepID=UPI0030EB3D16